MTPRYVRIRRFAELTGYTEFENLAQHMSGQHPDWSAEWLLGLDERTMRRYASGEYPVPVVVEYAIRWVAAQAA